MGFFYTGKGDGGASAVGGASIAKDAPILEALGEVDELNSLLGAIRAQAEEDSLREGLVRCQETLFIIQARLAWIMYPQFKAPQVTGDHIRDMEREIDALEEAIGPERGFVVPGSTPLGAWLDYARAVSRRTERRVVALARECEVPDSVKGYMNRLSSYLYASARYEAHRRGIEEKGPRYQ